MSYVECPKCGHRALSVATQCPHCGLDFLTEPPNRPVPVPEPEVPRLRRLLLLAGVLLAVILVLTVVVLVWRHGTGRFTGPSAPPTLDTVPSKPSQPAAEKSAKLADSARGGTGSPQRHRSPRHASSISRTTAGRRTIPLARRHHSAGRARPIARTASGQRIVAALRQGVGQRAKPSPPRRDDRSGLEAR